MSKYKIVCISDTHGYLPTDLPEGDFLCIAGDIMPLHIQRDNIESIVWLTTKFFPWVQSLPYKKVLMVAGNHDFVFEWLRTDRNGNHRPGKRVLKKLSAPNNLVLLDDSETSVGGLKFYGSSWCPDLENWAYYGDHDTLVQKFKKIPTGIDVLITHCPPRIERYGMVCQPHQFNTMADYGCNELACAVGATTPSLHIFGHVHSGDHVCREIGGTRFCNVSMLDENYKLSYEPTVIGIEK